MCFSSIAHGAGYRLGFDAGSSFSPHGIGFSLGLDLDPVALDLGWGFQSKLRRAGNPLSLTGFVQVLRFGGVLLGANYYSGSGERDILYSSERTARNMKTKWTFMYGYLGIFANPFKFAERWQLVGEAGITLNIYTKLDVEEDYEKSNLGEPVGMKIDDSAWGQNAMGPSDGGLFARLRIIYTL